MKFLFIMFSPYKAIQMQILILSAFLKSHGHQVDYLEVRIFTGQDFEQHKDEVRHALERVKPDMVGFSTYDMNYYHTLDCAAFIKEVDPRICTIAGGHTASLRPQDFIHHDGIDMICVGEGEGILLPLIDSIKNNTPLDEVKGLVWKNPEGEVVTNPAAEVVVDLDTLPYIDRDINLAWQKEYNVLPILAGRGCPYTCTYCANEVIKELYANKNNYERWRSPENIVAEIKECRERFDFEYVFFYDDIFCLKKKWLKEFCEVYRRELPGVPFHCCLRPELAGDESRMKLLKDAGCVMIHMGIESGSESYRRRMLDRRMSNSVIEKSFHLAKQYNIDIMAFMMVGMPDESFLDSLKTIALLLRMRPKGVQTAIFYPLTNTPLYDYCYKNDLVNEEKKKEIVVYTYDTCLKVGYFKRRWIILNKWIVSGTYVLYDLRWDMMWRFGKIQSRKWFLRRINFQA